jgi:hypothetical protein
MRTLLFITISAITVLAGTSAEAATSPFEQSRREINAVVDLMVKQNLAAGEIKSITKTNSGYMIIAGRCALTADVTTAPPPNASAEPGEVQTTLTGFSCANDRSGEEGGK